ncbi:MAG: PQQ-dependent sugar dehydrogenase [Candidatus Dadabacteria bacterium]|nr:PQQ-dependent sugar dehydrogenase [Candidatus Dadabacteria bacterium]
MRALRAFAAAQFAAVFITFAAAPPVLTHAAVRQTSAGLVEFTAIAGGLREPWSLAFLPDGDFLITLRGGEMRRYKKDGRFSVVKNVPRVRARGQGGLLDVMTPGDFGKRGEIFLSFSKPQGRRGGTALARARLRGDRLEDVKVIWELETGSGGGRHYGSRIAEGPDGLIYFTVGDRGDRPSAQDLSRGNGSVIRVARDGSIPADNPFAGEKGASPGIWSYGHRNAQGAAFDARGRLWVAEHGAWGGDEVNLIRRGANYGWPVISYGRHYSGGKIGVGTAASGMEQPEHYWDPSIAPSGMAFYSGDMFPEWEGDLLVGSLAFDLISRLTPDRGMEEAERIETPETRRVRDVRVAPDGSVWFLSVGNGTLYRMAKPGR